MKKVSVTNRNREVPCQRCGRKMGDVGSTAFATGKRRGTSATYCQDCGEIMQSTTETRWHIIFSFMAKWRVFRRFLT